MASRNKSRCLMKENKIPLGKKKENLNKIIGLKKNEEKEEIISQLTLKKSNNINISKPLKTININTASTNTSLTKPVGKPRTKLSTIKELEEKTMKKNAKTKLNNIKTIEVNTTQEIIKNKDNLVEEESTKLVRNLQENINIEDLNNTIDEMKSKPPVPEIILSPFICTTRGQKWKPSPRKPPKLSELLKKYEDDNVADSYRKKLDCKTIELQNNVKYWTELCTENYINIPQSIKDEIDVVCGQTKLLTTDKFMQMRSLIEEFDNKSGSMPINTSDLDGFWDMLLLQVQKLESQFSQLVILKENNWVPLQPVAKKIINKIPKMNKCPEVKSKIAGFLKNKKIIGKKQSPNGVNSRNNDSTSRSWLHEMKYFNNTCHFFSTPNSSNQKNINFTPMLLKTMELSYVARRSGMSPIVLAEPHVSPLKPALKNPEQEKGTKRKNIQFESPKRVPDTFVTPENSYNENFNYKNLQDRVVTPYTVKALKVNRNNVESQNNPIGTEKDTQFKKNATVIVKATKNTVLKEKLVDTQNSTIRRSSRLANKPSKNYKC